MTRSIAVVAALAAACVPENVAVELPNAEANVAMMVAIESDGAITLEAANVIDGAPDRAVIQSYKEGARVTVLYYRDALEVLGLRAERILLASGTIGVRPLPAFERAYRAGVDGRSFGAWEMLDVLPAELSALRIAIPEDAAAALLIDLENGAEVAPLARVAIAEKQDAARFLAELFTKDFRSELERRGHFEPYAELEVQNALAGATLRIDGEPKGLLAAGTTTLRLRAGSRAIAVEAEGHAPWTHTITLTRGSRSKVTAALKPVTGAPLRTALFWAGAGFAATGATLTTYALLKHDGDVNTFCLHGAGADPHLVCGSGSRFVTAEYDASAALEGRAPLNPRGVMLAPLGLAIASTGLTWSLSMLLFDRDADLPILELAIGLGAGVLTYSIAALANGEAAP